MSSVEYSKTFRENYLYTLGRISTLITKEALNLDAKSSMFTQIHHIAQRLRDNYRQSLEADVATSVTNFILRLDTKMDPYKSSDDAAKTHSIICAKKALSDLEGGVKEKSLHLVEGAIECHRDLPHPTEEEYKAYSGSPRSGGQLCKAGMAGFRESDETFDIDI